jgi:predicted metal-dependent hydrolase
MQLDLPFTDSPLTESAPHARRSSSTAQVEPAGFSTLGPCFFVRRRRARRYILRLDGEGRVQVTIPRGGSRQEAGAFAERNRDWIARERARLTSNGRAFAARSENAAQARVSLPPRLLELAALHGLQVTRVSIRNQRARWGSCGHDGHICLNWRLVLMPDWVRDYVMVHELMHLRRLDHSPAYWELVAAAYPAYRKAREWLRVHGSELR